MKKNVFGRQFKRDANERKALFKNLLTSLVLHERIRTTEAKAKAIKGAADNLITKAKKGGTSATRALHPKVNQPAVTKLIESLAPLFTNRQGGYTRIIRDSHRVADNAPMVYLEWTEKTVKQTASTKVKATKETKEEKVEKKDVPSQVKLTAKKEAKAGKEAVQKQARSRVRSGL
ncbi:MAG: 50S ribosomal protein L17 [Patescibacteria group bacterium]